MKKNYTTGLKRLHDLNNRLFLVVLLFTFVLGGAASYAQDCAVNAGNSAAICANGPVTLNGVVSGNITNFKWTQIAGPSVIIQNPNAAVTSVLGTVGGNTYTFRLSAVCSVGTTFQDVTFFIDPITISNAGTQIEGCPGTYSLSGNTPTNPGETGLWTVSGSNSGGVTINNPTSPTSTVTLSSAAAGTTKLVWTITSPSYSHPTLNPSTNSCTSSSSVNIINYGGEQIANAGPDQTLSECYTAKQATTLAASIGGNGTGGQVGTWSFVSGPAVPTISATNDPTTAVTNLIEGSYVFRWSVQGPCTMGTDTVTIIVPPATQAVTKASGSNINQRFCDPSITSTVLEGNTPTFAGETVLWTTNAPGVTIVSPTSPTTSVTGLNFSSTTNYTFTYTISGNSNVNPNCNDSQNFTVRYSPTITTIALNGGVDTKYLPVNGTSGSIPITATGGTNYEAIFINGPITPASSNLKFSGNNFEFSGLTTAGTYTFRIRRYTNGSYATGCSEAFADISIVVSFSPATANAGTSVALLCGVKETQLSGNDPATLSPPGLSGYWSQVSGPNTATFDDYSVNNPKITGLISGIYVFRWNLYGGPDAVDTFSEATITVSEPPVSVAGATPVTVCAGSYTFAAQALIPGQTGLWTQVDSNARVLFDDATNPTTYATGLQTSSSYTFRWTVSSAASDCLPNASDVVVNTTNDSAPSPAVAGSDICLPSGTTETTLAATTPAVGTGVWTQEDSNAAVNFADNTSPTTSVSGLSDGVYQFRWTTSTDPALCPTFSDTVAVTIAATPTSAAGPNQNVCANSAGDSVQMNANVPGAGLVGTWVQVSGSGTYTVDDVNSPTAIYSNLVPGNYVFKWVVKRGTCDEASSEMSFKVSLPPTAATVDSTPLSVCGTSTTLNGNTILAGTGTWQVVSGPNNPTIADYNLGNSAISNLTTGTYVLNWVSKNGPGCDASTATLTLNVYAAANAGPDQDLCNKTEVLLQGTEGSTGTWSQTSTGSSTITPISSSTARATISPGSTYTFQYAIAAAGTCPATTDTMTVTNSALPTTPDAGLDQAICLSGTTSTTLEGNTISAGTGTWTIVSGPSGASITNPSSPTSGFTGLTEGLYILNWTASNGSCTAFSDVVRINAYDPPSTASAGPDQTACQLATQLDAVAPTKGIGIWTLTTDPSSGGIVIDSPNNPKSTLTIANPYLLPVGDYVFTWTVSNGPACAVSTDTVTIKFTGAPPTPANAGPDQKLCGVTTAVMNANPVNPGTGTWTQVSGPSTAIFSNKFEAKSTVSGLETGEYLFKWTSESGGCSLEDTMKITISAAVATVEAGPDQTVEEFNAISMSATNPAPNTGTWTFVSGPNTPAILDINSPTTQIAGTVPGTYVFRFTVSNGTCDNISDTVSITIIGRTDLSLTKTASTLLPKVGDVVSFTVALKNEGNRDANGIAVTDILPIGMSLVPGTVSNSGTFNSGNNSINWTNLTVADQATLNLTYQVRINAPTGVANEYKNTAQVTASSLIDPDSTPNNNVATEDDQSSITLAPTPTVDIAIVKTANAAAPLVGSNITFNLEVKNNGPSNATGVVVTDIIPSGYTYLSSNTTLGTINSSNPATTGLVWNIGNLAKDTTVSMSIIATVKATGAYTNSATVVSTSTETDSNTANNTSSVTPTPVAVANLNLTKEISEGPYNVGSNVTFTVKVNNVGPSSATAVSVIDYLPSGYSYVSHNATGGYNPESGAWTIGTIANGAQASLIIVAKINASGDYRNVAEIVHSDQVDTNSTPGNNVLAEDDQAQQTITVVQVADLSLLKKVDNSTPRVGDNVKFTLELSNAGPSDATAVVVNDQLPIGYAFLSYTATSGTYDRISGNWELSGKVLSGKTEYLEIIARVNATTATTNEYRNNAQVTSSGTLDPDSTPNDGEGDDFATVSTNPTALIDLSLTNSVDNVAPVVGTNVVFTVTVNNAGPSTATGIQIRDIIRSGYTFVSATASDGTIDSADPTGTGLLWSIPSQLNGGNAVMTIIARVNPTGDFKNVAQIVTANETDVDSTPNNNLLAEDDQDEVTTSQVALIDLSLVKTVDVSEPNVGDNVTFTVNVKNTGPSAATGVVVTDKLPTGYAFVGFTVSQGNYVATTGSWTIGTMPSSSTEVVTLTVTAKVLADGNYNNIAEVTGANEIDSNSTPANNDSEETDQDEAFVSPKPIADLSVVKSVNISTPVVGTNVVFTIVVANAGPSTATGVIIEDILPNGYEFVSAVPSVGMYNSTSGLWTVSRPIVSGFSESIQITAKVLATGNYLNTASVNASNQIDPVVGNNTSTITTTPTASVDLVVVKRINNTTPNVGSTVNFTVEVTNNGPSTATDVIVTDQLQSGYTYLSDSSAGSYDAITGVWTIGTLASGATATLNISATVNATGDYGNRAVASSLEAESTPTNNSSSISSTPRPVANLKLSKTLLNGPLKVGENATFEIVVTNDGPSDATAVAVLDKLPSGFEFVSATPPGSSTYTSADGAWNIGAVANGATATMQITAKILSTGNYTNVAQITTSNEYDPNSVPGNNNPAEDDQSQVTVSPQPIADLSVAKTANTLTPAVGSNVVFTVVVKNEGPSAATGVVLKDLLASGYQFVSAVPSSGLYTETDGLWTLSRPIAAETSETIQITAKVLATGVYKNDAEVTKSDQLDPDSAPDDGAGDDFATVTPVPTALVDLVIVKRINDAVPNVGATVAFTVVVTNVGPSTATEVVVTDQLRSGYTFLSDTSGGTYDAVTGVWTIGTLASGATATLNISATVNATGDYGNSAVASSLEAESTPANNSTSISSTPRPVASLSLSKAIVNAPLKIGDNAIFELVVTNAGPSDATGVAVLDKLPSGFEFVSATPPGSSTYNSTTGAWNIGAIANGATATMQITAKVLATGNYTNVAEISASNQYDLNSIPGNNNPLEDDQSQVTVIPEKIADLSLLKKVDISTPRVGDNVKFTLELSNAGPSDATAVVVNDLLPSGYSVVSYTTTSGNYDADSGDWTLSGNVLKDKNEFLEIVAKVNPITGAANEYKNNAQVAASGTNDPDSTPNDGIGDDFATVSTVPTALIDLSLTKSVDNIAPVVGSNVVFTVTVKNAGPSTATGIEVADVLPSGYEFVSATPSATYNGTIWTIPSIVKDGSATLTVTAKVNPSGIYTNVAEVIKANETDIDSTPNNNLLAEDDQDEVTTSREPLIDLSLSKVILGGATPNVGDNVTFRITVKNAGPSDATGVVVTDRLPSGYAFVNVAPSQATYDSTTGSWSVGNLVNGGSASIDLVATVLATGNYNNIAEVTGATEIDSNSTPGNNDATENDQMQVIVTPFQVADLSVEKKVDDDTPVVGENVVFTIEIKNAGPSAATGVVIEDKLPSGYEFISATPTAGMYNRTTGLWTVSRPIVSGSSESIDITAKVLATGDYSNTAIVIASDILDPDLGNNSSTVNNIAPSAIVDLVVAKRISNPTPDVGSTVNFTVEVTNNGPSTATEVEVKDQLQSGYTYLSDSSAGSYDVITGVWTIGTLASGATATLNISATVNAAGDYGNSAVARSLEAESTPGNNSISISSTPRPVANLSLTKVVANQSINVGQNAVFNLVITNAGPSAATGVTVTDKLPSGYELVSANPSNGTTYDSASGAWVVGTVANGATATLSITAKVLAAGEYTNVAEVTGSDQFDPNSIPGNNNPIEDDQAQAFVTPINEANLVTVKTVSAVNVAGISASNPNEGDTIKYSLVVSNNGGPTNATAVTLTDLLPTGVTFVTYSATSGVYNYGSGIWTIGNINVNSSATLDITVKVNEGTKGTTITNQTTAATGDQIDPSTVGDDLIEMITVSKPPVATNDSNVGNIPNNASAPISILSNDTLQDGSTASTTTTTVDLDPSTPGIDNSILIPGEGTWNYDSAGGTIIFTPLNGFTTDPKPLQYQLTEAATGLSDTAIVTVDYITQAPTANNDTKGAAPKGPVTLDPLNGVGADTDIDGTIIASTVSLVIPSGATGIVTESSGDVTSFMVPNEGTWSLNPITAEITFTPLASFVKDPTPIEYTVKDNDGNISNKATVTIDYVPAAVNDKNDVIGIPTAPVTLNVVTNDNNGDTVNPASVVLLATSIASGVQVTPNQVDVPGVGSWTADVNGNVTFTPAIGYTQDPPIISYTVEDDEGNVSMPATITLDYAPISSTDLSTGNPINTPIVIDVVANDSNGDVIDPTTVSLVNPGNATNIVTDANGDITSLLIPGEGTWNVDLVTGAVTFTPNPGFIINPTPINYNVEDNEGNPSNNSLITIEMVPQADLVITKTDNKEKYTPGTNSVYTITVKNNGPAVATNVVVLDDISNPILEAVTTWSAVGTGSAVPPNATGTGDLTAANATIATVAVSETVTYTVTIAVPSNFTGQIANTASVSSDVQDPVTSNNSQTDVDTAAALAEIAVTKTVVSTAPYKIGENIEFLITATNNGPSDATGINIVDKLPSGYNLVSFTSSIGTFTPANGLWNVGGLTNKSSATLTVVATINETGNYTNSAEVTKVDQLDPNGIVHGNNTPSEIDQSDVTIVPVKIVDLVTTKTVDKSNPNQGDLVKYTLTVVNKGPSLATGVSLTDNLPAGLVYVSHVATGGTVNTYSGGLWTIGNINIGSSVTLVIDARVTAAGTPAQTPIVNTATAAIGNELDPTTVGDDLSEPIVVTSADLVTEKTVSNATPGEGETITYSIKVTNNGPSVATGVRLTDILPIGVTYASNNQGPDYNYGSGLWTVGDLAVGASKVLNVNVTINSGAAGKTIVNTTTAAKGDQSDPTDVGNDLNETIIVQNNADVVLTKTVDNNSPNIGDVVTYTVTVANKGTTLVTNLVVKDDLPAGLTYVSATPAKGTWTGPNWTVGTLLPGEKGSIVIKALVGMDQGGKVLTNTVSNTQDQFDINTTPDDPSETVIVTSLDLAVAKTVNNATPNIGDVITYTIQIKNNGASNATNVSLTDNLPVGVTYISNTVSQGVFNTGSGLWTVGDMANGSVATLTLNARVNEGTYGKTITNTTTPVKADQSDSNVSNNIGTVAIVPTAFIDLRLTKEVVANVTAPAVGEIIAFEIRVINDGPTKATGVQVVDLIPSGYKFKNYSSTIGTYSPLTGLWNIGFIEVGNTAVLIVDVEVLNSGDYLNCAEITRANEPDVDSTLGNGNVSEDDYACASVSPNQAVDLAVVKTILKNNSNPQVDSEISFEILLTNNGNIDATDVVVSDLLPAGYTFVNYSSTKGIYDYVTGNWKVSKILNGETEILIVDVLVNESGSYLNCATITALHQTDTNPDNNVSCIAAAPIAVIDLELSKTVDNLQPIAETNVEFTITLTNRGPSNATGVVVKDLLPSGFTFVNATITTGTYDQVTGVWNVGNIAIDQTQVLKVVAFVLPVGEFTNVAEVIAANELDIDSTPGNNKILEDDQDAVTIEPEISIVLSEGFTPNGDGINDVFEIQHLQVLYPNFSMEIVNRYGNIVYQYKHNGDKFTTPKWWDGYSHGRWNLTNDTLPAGTYFYTIYFNNDDRAPQTGWIYLRK